MWGTDTVSDKPAVPALQMLLLLLLPYSVGDTKPSRNGAWEACDRSRSSGSRNWQALGAVGNLGLEIVALFQKTETLGWSRNICLAFEKHT